MILLVAPPDDRHAAAVAAGLTARGERVALIDVRNLTAQIGVEAEFRPGHRPGGSLTVTRVDGAEQRIDLADISVGWWRRTWIPFLGADDPRLFGAPVDFGEAFISALEGLDISWANDPVSVDLAQRRTRLWSAARRAGLTMPHTLITRDPAAAHRFAVQNLRTGIVCRPLTKTGIEWPTQDRILGVSAVDDLVDPDGPEVVLRAFVAGADLRVWVAGDAVHAIEHGATPVDEAARLAAGDESRPGTAVDLPVEVVDAVRTLVTSLGLGHAAVDLRRTRAGEHLFLDLDPMASWLGAEQVSGLPLTAAIVDDLVQRVAARV
ncbi:RimK family alpha-L-glutamate ligase [Schumannella sp. 10F1B-5-1]|uniref:ATP-grasp domain-containing protein n=1 Tax=Schumannella sp. 10F1B-5-1 TaxID=2590780 RepID=UPI0011324639|nr:hypothetical protein [Schumannella sp. 10F1B-5-1]TPW72763.1 hypothetical protein FJ658_05665 [Schumannella sp. 10F1B-5-1]